MEMYLLIWALNSNSHSTSGSAKFRSLEECQEAKLMITSHEAYKKHFSGHIKCVAVPIIDEMKK